MKKITYILAAVAASVLFLSCEKQHSEGDVITFSTEITKADLIGNLSDLKEKGFATWCAYSQTGKFKDTKILLNREKVSWNNWRWTYSNPIEWSFIGSYKFNAIYPANYEVTSSGEKIVLEYESGQEKFDQDLMLAYSFREMSGQTSHETVNLAFSHMLSAVKFVFKTEGVLPEGYNMRFTNIGIDGIRTKGKLDFTDGVAEWNLSEEKNTVSYAGVSDQKWISVVPQTLSSEASVFFTVEAGSDEIGWVSTKMSRALSKDSYNKWEMGKRYTYTVTIENSCDILVEVSESDWNDVGCETPEIVIR